MYDHVYETTEDWLSLPEVLNEGLISMDWKRTLRFGKGATLGLDIGSTTVKMIVLAPGKSGYSITAAGIARIAKGDPGHGDRRSNTMNAIRECFAQMQTKVKFAVGGVSGQDVAVRDFEFAPLQEDEIAAAVSLEASQVCPFNVTDIAVDYQVIPHGNAKTKGVLVAATSTIVADKTQLIRDAGLKCVLMDVDGLALLNCYNTSVDADPKHPAEQSVAILNVGASHTTLAIMDKNGWPFIRDMSQAGDDILMQLAALHDTSTETIRDILFNNHPVGELDVHNSLAKTCQALITDITGSLRYYAAQGKSTDIEKIHVCGGFALAEGFVDLLNSRLGIEAVLWNPFDQMRFKSNRRCEEICTKSGPAMAIAAGLAMRTLS
ncbi:MAG: type IV pilus assembly protein PilM [Sedimentisphaerales bacterium]|nr:type IV pilus assembly protein PilM [Sedimentisphaerales bacterium]